jgi:23S rRNA (cytosine1962-C5)-methyltransferase
LSKHPKIFSTGWSDYSLLDAGGGLKLERWGEVITIRPEHQAYFRSELPFSEWKEKANWKFEEKGPRKGFWKSTFEQEPSKKWTIDHKEIKFQLELTQFKHLGLFPEQKINWDFIDTNISEGKKMLNLFAYTGASSLAARKTGADVIHVDSMKQMLDWTRINQEISELDGIKWVAEDALKFAQREVKRGNKYDLIQMDPPAFGIGAKGEKWKLEDKLTELIQIAYQLLNKGGWLILNTYSPRVELAKTAYECKQIFRTNPETQAELWMKTETKKDLFFGHLIRIQK